MSKGFFTDKTLKPTVADISGIIGKARCNWESIIIYLTRDLKLKGDFRFYGINYGWAMRFNKSGKSVVALYPGKDCFTVQVILNKNQVESALSDCLDTGTINLINETVSIHEGKWIYLKVGAVTELKDIRKLISIRVSIK